MPMVYALHICADIHTHVLRNFIRFIYPISSGFVIMASHQTFSGQIKHLCGQIKFIQTNLLYRINGEVIEFAKGNGCLNTFHSLP